jgi:hypothetical protein
MLECNPPRNSQPKFYRDDGAGGGAARHSGRLDTIRLMCRMVSRKSISGSGPGLAPSPALSLAPQLLAGQGATRSQLDGEWLRHAKPNLWIFAICLR